MNFIPVTVQGTTAKASGFDVQLPRAPGIEKGVLGLRPEDIDDADLHPEYAAECCLEATIDVVEMMGNEVFLNGSIGEQELVARVESETSARDGAPHRLAFNLRKAHLFDPVTSAAIR